MKGILKHENLDHSRHTTGDYPPKPHNREVGQTVPEIVVELARFMYRMRSGVDWYAPS